MKVSAGGEPARPQLKGFVWEAVNYDDEDHGSVVLRSHYAGLRKIYDGWQFPRDPATGAISGGLKGVEEHYRKLSERMKFLLGQGNTEEAVAAFKLNAERYPGSANVYDSLAEAYERGGKLDLALANYEKAHALGVRTNDPNTSVFKANLDRVSELTRKAKAAGGTEEKK